MARSRIRPAAWIALMWSLSALPMSARQAPPGDCEVRRYTDSITNDSVVTLTLVLKGPKSQPLPVNLVFTAVRKAKARRDDPPEVRLEFHLERFVGQTNNKPPHVVFVLNPGTKNESTLNASFGEKVSMIGAIGSVTMPFSLAELVELGKAEDISGRVVGIEFALTRRQVEAIAGFPKQMPR